MKTKKHIDRLFKEQFKHLDVTPPPVVWENISAALQKEKAPKRVVPLWYKLAGVAAALVLFLGIGNFFIDSPFGNQITSEDTQPNQKVEIIQPDDSIIVNDSQNDAIVQQQGELTNENETSELVDQPKASDKISNKIETQTVAAKPADQKSVDKKQLETSVPSVKTDIAQTNIQYKNTETITSPEAKPSDIITDPITEEKDAIALIEIKEDDKKISLLDYIAQKHEDEIASNQQPQTGSRWEVSPNFAPVYYNTLGSGSSIDPQFSNNSKSGDINYSYGINVSYAINDKLSIRTGVNRVDLSYSTNNIEFAVAEASDGLRSIDYGDSNYIVAVGNRGTLRPPPGTLPTVSEDGSVIVPRNGIIPGTMQQELNYFEVPLELKYNISNNRVGVNVIGGMSTLLLGNNSISVMTDGFRSEIGSANNLNNLSFSTNLGLGFDYKFSNRFIFNLEPVFKYQLNAYNDSAIDFKPYIFGVYSGFSYKF
jgi:hypothetical protein